MPHTSRYLSAHTRVSSENTPPFNYKKPKRVISCSKTSSVLSKLLVYPIPSESNKKSSNFCALVLTSAESLAILEEKERAKKDKEQLRLSGKKEREDKIKAKEKEKQRKLQEKQAKQKEVQAKARSQGEKRKSSSRTTVNCRKRKRVEALKVTAGMHTSTDNECAVCSGQYTDENGPVDDSEWIPMPSYNYTVLYSIIITGFDHECTLALHKGTLRG